MQPRNFRGNISFRDHLRTHPTDANSYASLKRELVRKFLPQPLFFEFPEVAVWRHAKTLLDQGAIGTPRHVMVSWNVENAATRLRLKSWSGSRIRV